MDDINFKQACNKIINAERVQNGIGTLGEKTVHAVLKWYMDPHEENHEIKIGGYVADVVNQDGIIEIQTRNFDKLRSKLLKFLEVCPVTIVYPIPYTKWLYWIDPGTGELSKKRKSPKTGRPWEIFYELYKIKNLLNHPNMRLTILLIDMDEYRYLNGWSADKKKGSTRCDRIPTTVVEQVRVNNIEDYIHLIPPDLLSPFTSKDFQKKSKLSLSKSQKALNVLYSLRVIERVGKKGNAYLYEISVKNPLL